MVGLSFDSNLISSVFPLPKQTDEVEVVLDELHKADFVDPADEIHLYRFNHALHRDTAYGLLLHTQRRSLHKAVAKLIGVVTPNAHAAIAYHFGQALLPEGKLQTDAAFDEPEVYAAVQAHLNTARDARINGLLENADRLLTNGEYFLVGLVCW